jgi:PST family polysaccharide transporter
MGLIFGGLAVLARLLGPREFGLFGMAMAAVSFFEVARDFGLRGALIYYGRLDEAEAARETGFWLGLGVGLVLTASLLLLAGPASVFFGDPEVSSLLAALAVYFLIASVGIVPDALLRQRLDFRRRFWPEAGAPFARYGVAIVLAAQGLGVWSLVWGQLAGMALSVLLAVPLASWMPRPRFRAETARKLLAYGGQMSAVDALAAVILNLDYVVVGHALGSVALGLYTLAFKVPDAALVALAFVLYNLLLPTFVQLGDDRDELRGAFLTAMHVLTLVLAPAAAGIAILAPALVPFLFGEQWLGSIPVLQLLAIASFFRGVLFAPGAVFPALGRQRLHIGVQLVWALTLSPLLVLAAQRDLVAVGAVQVAAVLVYGAVKLALVRRLLGFAWLDLGRTLLPSLTATALMALALLGLLAALGGAPAAVVVLLGVPLGAAVYVAAISLLDAGAVRQGRELARRAIGRDAPPSPAPIVGPVP